MSKLSVALRLADELGTSVSKAQKFVDDVGLDAARRAADDVVEAGSRTVSDWWRPAAVGGGLIGAGGLAWRQQTLEQARAIASQKRSEKSAVAELVNSDLPPEAKRELINSLLDEGTNGGETGSNGGDNGLKLPFLGGESGPFGQIQALLALVIVTVLVLQYAGGE